MPRVAPGMISESALLRQAARAAEALAERNRRLPALPIAEHAAAVRVVSRASPAGDGRRRATGKRRASMGADGSAAGNRYASGV